MPPPCPFPLRLRAWYTPGYINHFRLSSGKTTTCNGTFMLESFILTSTFARAHVTSEKVKSYDFRLKNHHNLLNLELCTLVFSPFSPPHPQPTFSTPKKMMKNGYTPFGGNIFLGIRLNIRLHLSFYVLSTS